MQTKKVLYAVLSASLLSTLTGCSRRPASSSVGSESSANDSTVDDSEQVETKWNVTSDDPVIQAAIDALPGPVPEAAANIVKYEDFYNNLDYQPDYVDCDGELVEYGRFFSYAGLQSACDSVKVFDSCTDEAQRSRARDGLTRPTIILSEDMPYLVFYGMEGGPDEWCFRISIDDVTVYEQDWVQNGSYYKSKAWDYLDAGVYTIQLSASSFVEHGASVYELYEEQPVIVVK